MRGYIQGCMDTIRASKPRPLLIVSDSISCTSGLGRIARDLATRIHANLSDVFRVGTCGYGGPGSSKFKFPEYHVHSIDNWLLPELPQIASDFAPDGDLILMPIWDLSRLYWMADTRSCPIPHLRRWLETAKMQKWLYHPIDGEGPNGKIPGSLAPTMAAFDRIIDYSAFSCAVTGNKDHLPHGIDASVFFPRDKKECRQAFRSAGFANLKDKSLLVGIVATNQVRKDWAIGIQTCRELLERGHDVRVWCHTDSLDRHWNIPNLIVDYHLQGRVAITTANFTDEQMNGFYSACDVTLGIGLGEGFGYPIFESLASGTPCIHGKYGGAAEHMPPSMLIDPIAARYEGIFCMKRPVFDPKDWADAVESNIGLPTALPDHLDWNNLWKQWEAWFRKGISE